MKEIEGVYSNYLELDCCVEHPLIQNEICPFHKRLTELDLKIIKDVEVLYYVESSHKHIAEHISFKEFKYRVINDKKFLPIFYVVLEGENYEIEQIGPEVWVRSFDKKAADLIYNMIK